MKKSILVGVIIGMIAVALVAPDAGAAKKKKPKPRTFEGTYSCPCGVQVNGIGPAFRLGSGEGGFEVGALPGEKFMSLELTDDSGTPVYFEIAQDVDGDGTLYEHATGAACGKTEEPVPLAPNAPIIVFVQSGQCDTGAGLATGGTFKAILSATP
jgi:hypothetical protein